MKVKERTTQERIQSVILPNLVHLYLDPPPRSIQTGDSSLLFKKLNAEKLEICCLLHSFPKELKFLRFPCLKDLFLFLFDLQITKTPGSAIVSLSSSSLYFRSSHH